MRCVYFYVEVNDIDKRLQTFEASHPEAWIRGSFARAISKTRVRKSESALLRFDSLETKDCKAFFALCLRRIEND